MQKGDISQRDVSLSEFLSVFGLDRYTVVYGILGGSGGVGGTDPRTQGEQAMPESVVEPIDLADAIQAAVEGADLAREAIEARGVELTIVVTDTDGNLHRVALEEALQKAADVLDDFYSFMGAHNAL